MARRTSLRPTTAITAANGGKPPYTWSLIAGALPPGLTLSASGTITGTPTAPGTSSFTVQVTDSASATITQMLTLAIAPPSAANPPALNPQSLQFSYNLGDPPPDPQTVMVGPAGDAPLSFTATVSVDGDVPWLQIDTAAGATPANIQVAVANIDMLAPGVYQGVITVTAPDAGPPSQTVAVQLTIVDPNAATASGMRKRPVPGPRQEALKLRPPHRFRGIESAGQDGM
jgi:hypothetical protein